MTRKLVFWENGHKGYFLCDSSQGARCEVSFKGELGFFRSEDGLQNGGNGGTASSCLNRACSLNFATLSSFSQVWRVSGRLTPPSGALAEPEKVFCKLCFDEKDII